MNQSINQSTNQSTNQPINQSTNQPINQSIMVNCYSEIAVVEPVQTRRTAQVSSAGMRSLCEISSTHAENVIIILLFTGRLCHNRAVLFYFRFSGDRSVHPLQGKLASSRAWFSRQSTIANTTGFPGTRRREKILKHSEKDGKRGRRKSENAKTTRRMQIHRRHLPHPRSFSLKLNLCSQIAFCHLLKKRFFNLAS